MRLYAKQHAHYCGIDLHARTMHLCILDANGEVVLHKNVQSSPEAFLRTLLKPESATWPNGQRSVSG